MTTATPGVHWYPEPDWQGYWKTLDDRWRAKPYRPTGEITLVDETERVRFADNGDQPWTRLPDWQSVAMVVRAFP